jgi:hypothetical protein
LKTDPKAIEADYDAWKASDPKLAAFAEEMGEKYGVGPITAAQIAEETLTWQDEITAIRGAQ